MGTVTTTSGATGSAGYTLTNTGVSSLNSTGGSTCTANIMNLSLADSNTQQQNFVGLVVDLSTGAEQTDAPEATEMPVTA